MAVKSFIVQTPGVHFCAAQRCGIPLAIKQSPKNKQFQKGFPGFQLKALKTGIYWCKDVKSLLYCNL
jgi:hypothetical protein